jgi:quercetin dioxygenase-like cupin family protein
MLRLLACTLIVTLATAGTMVSAQQKVDRKGSKSTVKLERPVSGHLTEINGKYKLIATETVYEPGGYTGEHHHVGPGIRYIISGELTFVEEGKTRVHKPGDFFYESGDITNAAYNKSNAPVRVLIFELLPVDWKGGSAVPAKQKK